MPCGPLLECPRNIQNDDPREQGGSLQSDDPIEQGRSHGAYLNDLVWEVLHLPLKSHTCLLCYIFFVRSELLRGEFRLYF